MTAQQTDSALRQRLDFIELDEAARKSMRDLRPVISELIGGALDKFYAKIAKTPAVAGFFADKNMSAMPRSANRFIGPIWPAAPSTKAMSTA